MSAPGTTRPRRATKEMTPGRLICVGTHHKTGTVWMRRVLHNISQTLGVPLVPVYRAGKVGRLPERGPVICVHWSSGFPQALLDHPEARFIHLIRDPRDVLISGHRYHLVAGRRNEKFLSETRPEWNGLDYQEHLRALPTLRAQLLFEMAEKHHETLQQMLAWDYGHPHSVELAYEDLMEDAQCTLFRAALTQVAPPELDIDAAVRCYWEESLFGGKAKATNRDAQLARHVSGAAGRPAQWVDKLPRDVAETYEARYGDALRTLGYETRPDWVEACPAPDEEEIVFLG